MAFLDPINAHFSPNYNVNHAQDVGRVLGRVQKMAADSRVTVIGNLHTSRRSGGVSARDNYAHQLEFRRIARSTFIIGRTPDDSVEERTIVHDKHNYSEPAPALKTRIEGVTVSGLKNSVGRITITGESDAAVEDVFIVKADQGQGIERAKQERTKAQSCADAIIRERARVGNPETADAWAFDKVTTGFDKSTVARARKKMNVTTEPVHDDVGRIVGHLWRFP